MDTHDSLYLFILAIVQGLTEVLPISSSGHLALIQRLRLHDTLSLATAFTLHGGSLLAITYWFRHDLRSLWRCFRNSWPLLKDPHQLFLADPNEHRVPYFMLVSLIPVAVVGALFEPWAKNLFSEWANWVPILLLINGLIILAVAHWTRGEKKLDELAMGEYLLIGIIQGFAVLPGISRLGLTLCAGLWRGLNWYEALRLAFILALPTIAGAIALQLFHIRDKLTQNILLLLNAEFFFLLFSIAVAAVMSLLGLYLLTSSLLERRTLDFFGYYCCLLGAFSFAYIAAGF